MEQSERYAGKYAEFVVLFILLPLFVRYMPEISHKTGITFTIPIILILHRPLFAYLFLRLTSNFKPADIVSADGVSTQDWLKMLVRFAFFAVVLAVPIFIWKRNSFLALPLNRPNLWIKIMFFYPLVSVLPQGLLYRALYQKRYAPVFPERIRILAGAMAFSFAHIAFTNYIAVVFTFIGGLMFLFSYKKEIPCYSPILNMATLFSL